MSQHWDLEGCMGWSRACMWETRVKKDPSSYIRTAMGKNSAVSYYKYSPYIQQGEKTRSEERRKQKMLKKIPVELLKLKDTALDTKKHTG